MYSQRLFYLLGLAGLGAAVAASPLSTHSIQVTSNPNQLALAPVLATAETPINNSYIVVLKNDISPGDFAVHQSFVQDVHAQAQASDDMLLDVDHGLKHVYDSHMKGYSGTFAASTLDKIRSRPEVDYVELDQVVYTMKTSVQKSAPWVS